MSQPKTPPTASILGYQPQLARRAYTAGEWPIHAWGIGSAALYLMYEQFYLIFNIHTTVFKVNVALVGAILALPRLVDGILDPILGHWSDNMRSRWGRRRPFLLIAAIVGAIMVSAMFMMSPEWPQWIKATLLALVAITLFTATGTYDMAHTALGYELSEDYSDRSRIQSIKGVYWSLFCIFGGYVIWIAGSLPKIGDFLFGDPSHPRLGFWTALRPWLLNGDGTSNEVIGFRVISLFAALMMLVTMVFPLLYAKERYVKINRQHVNLWKALKATLRCRPFVIILLIQFANGAGTLSRNLFFYIGVYSVCFGDKEEYSRIMSGDIALVSFFLCLIVWPLTKPLTRLIGKRASFILGAALNLINVAGLPFVATPGHVRLWFWYNVIFMPISMVIAAPAAGIMPDICDLDELKHGERREGLFTAVQSFMSKMQMSINMLLTGGFLAWTGFDASLGAHQRPEAIARMRMLGFTPLIIVSALAFVISCFMPITAKMMAQVRAELDARHAAAGTAAKS